MKKIVAVIALLSIVVAPTALWAEVATPVQVLDSDGYISLHRAEPASVDWSTGRGRKDWSLRWAVDDNYIKKNIGMFNRGLSNAAFGWVEILTHPFRWTHNTPAGTGLIPGVLFGVTNGVLRTVSGALDLATFWVPFWHGVPMKKPVLGLHDTSHYGTIDDLDAYNKRTKRYFFNGLSKEY
jgi:putative exosortase-associated protein (TIGR04073 family)